MSNINFNEEFKDKGLKIAVGILLIVVIVIIIVLSVTTVSRINNGKHVKVFGLEYNIPSGHPDTVIKFVNTVDNIKTKDIVRKIESPTIKYRKSIVRVHDMLKITTEPQAKNLLKGNVSGGTVQVGDNYNGIKQRHLTTNIFNSITSKIPDKLTKFWFLYAGDKESLNYGNELYNALLNEGYKNIELHTWMDPDGFDKIYVTTQNDILQVRLCPASNVQ